MRGEDAELLASDNLVTGSPPHARGRRRLRADIVLEVRITPACAGKTHPFSLGTRHLTDHPRMRGEDTHGSSGVPEPDGSPPHARGRRSERRGVKLGVRITPACAGKTPILLAIQFVFSDHPRMRGEDQSHLGCLRNPAGSPPHARGRLPGAVDRRRRDRITPACAGKTSRLAYPCSRGGDHPRMRGEDRWRCWVSGWRRGSPPHARGRQLRRLHRLGHGRITPACAGKTG